MRNTQRLFLILLLLGLAIGLLIFVQPFEGQQMSGRADRKVAEESVANQSSVDVPLLTREAQMPQVEENERQISSELEGPGVLVQVMDAAGQVIAEAQVFAWIGEDLRTQGETDELGEVILQGLSGRGGLVIVAPDFLPVAFLCRFDEGALELRIEAQKVLSGKVVFLRPRPNTKAITLQLDNLWWPGREDIPQPVYDVLSSKGIIWNDAIIPVDSTGHFRLKGMPAKWRGRIYAPPGMIIRSFQGLGEIFPPHMVKLHGAQKNIVLELVEFPEIRGRVVTPDGSKGVAGVEIAMRVFFNIEETAQSNLIVTSEENGVFRTPFRVYGDEIYAQWSRYPESAAPVRVQGSLKANQDWAGAYFSLELAGKSDPWNIGDLAMKNQHMLALHVSDLQGNPIAGALAFGGALSEATDMDGNTKVPVRAETEHVEVAAEGYDTVALALPDSSTDIFQVTLAPAARLHVSWNSPEGSNAPRLKLRIRSEGSIFSFREFDIGSSKARFLSAFQRDFQRAQSLPIAGGWINWKIKSQQQSFSIWGLQSNVPMQVMIVGNRGMPYASSSSFVLVPGEEHRVELQLPNPLPAYEGIVLDHNGAPIATAAVIIGGYGVSTTTDGKFRLDGFAPQEVDLSIRKSGYGALVFSKFRFSQDGVPAVFMLEPARQVTVFLRDADGHNYAGGFVSLGFASGEFINSAFYEDGYHLNQVPQGECEVSWALGDLSGSDWIAVGVEEHIIEVPAMERSTIRISRSTSAAQLCKIECWPLSEEVLSPEDFHFTHEFEFVDGQQEVEFELPPLSAGPYRVLMFIWRGLGAENFEPLQRPRTVEITPGQLLELNLED